MNKILIGLSIGILTSVTTAQIPMSNFTRTFSSSLTRGFYFQAPASFIVTHVQVPDESNKGTYQFAIYKLTQAPPAYSAKMDVKPLEYQSGVKSTTRAKLTSPAIYKKGDWFAILGCAGPTSGTCSNSYGAAANKSFLFGLPITLNRCGVQANIGVGKGVGKGSGGMWSENRGPIGRVRVWIGTGADSAARCNLASSTVASVPDANSPALGNKAAIRVKAGTTNTATFIAFGTKAFDVNLPGFGRLCVAGILGIAALPASSTAGTTVVLGTIPISNALVGVKIYTQAALKTTSGPIPLSNGLDLTIGN